MSLFIVLTVLSFIDAYKTRLISWFLKFLPQSNLITSINNDIIALERELSRISLVNEFAKHVKLQRRINKLREEKKELAKQNAFKLMKIRFSLITASYVLVLGSLVIIIWLYRKEPVAHLPAHWLWPVSSFFDWSYYTPGTITVPCWVAISSSALKTFAKNF